jgi:argininosuccinate lyase
MIVGRLVNMCIQTGENLETLTLRDFRAISGAFDEDVYKALELHTCVNERQVPGGPARSAVERQIASIRAFVEERSGQEA